MADRVHGRTRVRAFQASAQFRVRPYNRAVNRRDRALYHQIHTEARSLPDVIGLRLYVEEQNTRAHETYRQLGLLPGGYFVMERMHRRSV